MGRNQQKLRYIHTFVDASEKQKELLCIFGLCYQMEGIYQAPLLKIENSANKIVTTQRPNCQTHPWHNSCVK